MEAIARLKESVDGATPRVGADRARRERAVDWFWALFSFGLALAMIATGGLGEPPSDQRDFSWLALPVVAGNSLPLIARRRAPVAVFLLVMASFVVLLSLRYPPDVPVGPAVALFTLAQASGRAAPSKLALALAVGSFLAVGVALALTYDDWFAPEAPFTGALWLAIWLAGRGHRLKQEHIASLEERAERAEREAERERRLAAAEERTRIARDLHDSAGHAINVILVEAGAARLLRERDPERAERALETIEQVAREQIDEIDRLVHRLRADDPAADPLDMTMPAGVPPGPEAADQLFERMRASGLDLQVDWLGERRRVGPVVGRGAYRILQEALTNAQRHGTGSARVQVAFGEEEVEFWVENPINGEEPSGEGHGLVGMRERVALLGGRFEAGPADGRFRVQVALPYDCEFDPKRHPPLEQR